jgi:hypothetical protein
MKKILKNTALYVFLFVTGYTLTCLLEHFTVFNPGRYACAMIFVVYIWGCFIYNPNDTAHTSALLEKLTEETKRSKERTAEMKRDYNRRLRTCGIPMDQLKQNGFVPYDDV